MDYLQGSNSHAPLIRALQLDQCLQAEDWLSHHRQYVIQCKRRTYRLYPWMPIDVSWEQRWIFVLQNQILFKNEQPKAEKDETWMQEFELDWLRCFISKKQLREFGLLIGFGFPILIGWLLPSLFGHEFRAWTLWVGFPGLILGLVAPWLLYYHYKGWMALDMLWMD